MSETSITIEAKILGQRAALQAPWQMTLSTNSLSLHQLLEQIVRQEVQAFRQREQDRRLLRVLGPREITEAARSGKIVSGGVDELHPAQAIDEGEAIAIALQAFTDGLYFVFLNGQQLLDLEDAVQLLPASTLTFIRLVPLAGG
jgi:hypothetical protein